MCIWEFFWQLKQYRICNPLLLLLCTVPHWWASENCSGNLELQSWLGGWTGWNDLLSSFVSMGQTWLAFRDREVEAEGFVYIQLANDCYLICKIEDCYPASCFWLRVASSGGCFCSAKCRTPLQFIHNLFISTSPSHTVYSAFTSVLFSYFTWSSRQTRVTSWCPSPFSFFCVFQLHLFTQLPCSEERVRASSGGLCCLREWKADLQECAGRWRHPVPGAEWSQATFELCFHKR